MLARMSDIAQAMWDVMPAIFLSMVGLLVGIGFATAASKLGFVSEDVATAVAIAIELGLAGTGLWFSSRESTRRRHEEDYTVYLLQPLITTTTTTTQPAAQSSTTVTTQAQTTVTIEQQQQQVEQREEEKEHKFVVRVVDYATKLD